MLESEKNELETFYADLDKKRNLNKKKGKLDQKKYFNMESKIEFQVKQIVLLKKEKVQNIQHIKKLERKIVDINMKLQGYTELKRQLEN